MEKTRIPDKPPEYSRGIAPITFMHCSNSMPIGASNQVSVFGICVRLASSALSASGQAIIGHVK